jgi:hypothetical protein
MRRAFVVLAVVVAALTRSPVRASRRMPPPVQSKGRFSIPPSAALPGANVALVNFATGFRYEQTNRLNRKYQITEDGMMNNQAQFNYGTKKLGINYFPAYYQVPTNFMKATSAYAPRQIQFALRVGF